MPVEPEISTQEVEQILESEADSNVMSDWYLNRPKTNQERIHWERRFMALFVTGKSQNTIAEITGASAPTVSRYLGRAFAREVMPRVEEARKQQMLLVLRQLEAWLPRSEAGDEKAAAVVARFLDRLAKLTGTDAPIQVETTHLVEDETSRHIKDLVNQMHAQNRETLRQIAQ